MAFEVPTKVTEPPTGIVIWSNSKLVSSIFTVTASPEMALGSSSPPPHDTRMSTATSARDRDRMGLGLAEVLLYPGPEGRKEQPESTHLGCSHRRRFLRCRGSQRGLESPHD